jgi:hypothetical protein
LEVPAIERAEGPGGDRKGLDRKADARKAFGLMDEPRWLIRYFATQAAGCSMGLEGRVFYLLTHVGIVSQEVTCHWALTVYLGSVRYFGLPGVHDVGITRRRMSVAALFLELQQGA